MSDVAKTFDVVIIGGAVMESVAYHLAADPHFSGSVLVLEKDPSYARCASALSAASIRQQFSTPVNIDISLHGIAFLRRIGDVLDVDGERPDVALKEGGYLFLATEAGRETLAANHLLQQKHGADIELLDRDGLVRRFPWLALDGIAAGGFGASGEGWFDGYGLMQAFRRKARALGVTYEPADAVGLERQGGRVTALRLADGSRIGAGAVVNCAGVSGGAAVARAAGLEIPVRSRKRMVFTFDCRERLDGFPLLIDASGVYCRPEGSGYICGSSPPEAEDPDSDEFEVDYLFFEETVWPVLAARVPAFEAIKPGRAWAGHYDMNVFDHNAFVGRAPGLDNFYLCNGFSGHGIQQAPAIGRGLAELIAHGSYRTLDLSPLSFDRYLRGMPLIERNVV